MTSETHKVSRSDRAIRPIILACYPEWKGRKVSICVTRARWMQDYWSEGSRVFVRAFDLATGRIADPVREAQIPFYRQAHASVTIPDGIALVEHQIFCGKDAGVTICVTAASLARLLPGRARVDGPVSPGSPTAVADSLTRNASTMKGSIPDSSPRPGLTPGHLHARTCAACPRTLAPSDPVDGICDHCAQPRAPIAGAFVDAADWDAES